MGDYSVFPLNPGYNCAIAVDNIVIVCVNMDDTFDTYFNISLTIKSVELSG